MCFKRRIVQNKIYKRNVFYVDYIKFQEFTYNFNINIIKDSKTDSRQSSVTIILGVFLELILEANKRNSV